MAVVHCGSTAKSTTNVDGGGHVGNDSGSDAAIECGANGSCPTGYACGFAIGSCSAKGQCISNQESTGTCNISQVFCGCGDAGPVYAGCSSYASAPTTGSQDCTLPDQAQRAPDGGTLSGCATAVTTSPCSSACGGGQICVQAAPPDIGCVADASVDSGISCARAPGSCVTMPSLGTGDGCTSLLNQFCSSNGSGQPDGGAYGSVEALASGAFAVSCENEP